MNRLTSLAAVAVFALAASSAHAATIDITLEAGDVANITTGGAPLFPNINLHALPAGTSLNLVHNSFIIGPPAVTSTDNYARPTGPIFGNSYLAVLGTGNPGTATFTLSNNRNAFGFTWGTVDTYNTLTLTATIGATTDTYTINGTEILTALGLPLSDSGKTLAQGNIVITDPSGLIGTAEFQSSQNSFEAANFSERDKRSSGAPLPAALPLFGTALLGLFFYARRKRVAVRA